MVNDIPETRLATAAGRRVDLAAARLLGAALPAGFRDRQRGEWLSDLGTLGAGARLRYLIGAARTLPGLRRSALRHSGPAGLEGLRLTGAGTAARILLAGLIWPVLSWIVFLPLCYYLVVAPRLRAAEGSTDPQSLLPLFGTPDWSMPLWVLFYYGAWSVVLGGSFLVSGVTLVGSLALVRRSRGRRGRLLGVVVLCCVVLVFGMWSITVGVWGSGAAGAIVAMLNGRYTIGLLGALAVLCGVRVADLTRRARVGLRLLGVAAMAIAVWSYTEPGQTLTAWFMD